MSSVIDTLEPSTPDSDPWVTVDTRGSVFPASEDEDNESAVVSARMDS